MFYLKPEASTETRSWTKFDIVKTHNNLDQKRSVTAEVDLMENASFPGKGKAVIGLGK